MVGWLARLICKVVVVVKNIVLDTFIGLVPGIIFGKECAW